MTLTLSRSMTSCALVLAPAGLPPVSATSSSTLTPPNVLLLSFRKAAMIRQQPGHPAILLGLQVDAQKRAELAAVPHDALSHGLALGIVAGKRGVDVVAVLQGLGQRLRVAARLGHAEAHVRPRGRGG